MTLVTDSARLSPQHLVILRPNVRFMCLEENNIGLAVATQADPAEAGSAHVYMQAYRARVAHFLNNQRLISTCLPHAKDISSTRRVGRRQEAVAGNNTGGSSHCVGL